MTVNSEGERRMKSVGGANRRKGEKRLRKAEWFFG